MTITLLGLPTDINSSFLRGAAKAPPIIRAALWSDRGNLAAENGMELGHDIDLRDAGDLDLQESPDDVERIRARITEIAKAGDRPLCLGGDHFVTFPVIAGLYAVHGPLNILHFDAHPDL
ncbi:MAG: agmatinase, partial [Pseudomonadota bacterium]